MSSPFPSLATIQKQICCLAQAVAGSADTTYTLTGESNPAGGYDVILTGSDGSVNTVTVPASPDTTYELTGAPNPDPSLGFDITLTGSDGSEFTVTIPIPEIEDLGDFTAEADPVEPCAYQLTHTTSSGLVQTVGDIGRTNRILLDPGSTEHSAANNDPYITHQIAGSNPDANDGIAIPDSGDETRGDGADFSKVVDTSAACIRQSSLQHGRREAGVVVVDEKFYADTPRVERNDLPFQFVPVVGADREWGTTFRFFGDVYPQAIAWDTDLGDATFDATGLNRFGLGITVNGTGNLNIVGRPGTNGIIVNTGAELMADIQDLVSSTTYAINVLGGFATIDARDVVHATAFAPVNGNAGELVLKARDIRWTYLSAVNQWCVQAAGSANFDVTARDLITDSGSAILAANATATLDAKVRNLITTRSTYFVYAANTGQVNVVARDMTTTGFTFGAINAVVSSRISVKCRDIDVRGGAVNSFVSSGAGTSRIDLQYERAFSNVTGHTGYNNSQHKIKGHTLTCVGGGGGLDGALVFGNADAYVEIDRIEYGGTTVTAVINIDGVAELYLRNSYLISQSPDAQAAIRRHTAPSSVSHLTFNGVIIRVAAPTIPVFNNAGVANALRVYSHGETFTNSTVLNGGSTVAISGGTIVLGAVIPPL